MTSHFLASVTLAEQQIGYAVAMVALNYYFAVFYGSSDTAPLFEHTAEFCQIVVRADESSYDGYDFACTVFAVAPYAQVLFARR